MKDLDGLATEVFAPGEFLREELEARGWSQVDFAGILGEDVCAIGEIVAGRRAISPDMARAIGMALGTSPDIWMQLEASFQRYQSEPNRPDQDALPRGGESMDQASRPRDDQGAADRAIR